mmetsp:Transcript_12957/g.16211  ORF Transcript_12957/g.16211 Transcript_12957/m.16211 type:complete len:173 (-) Transcript_12957:22-540(-)
MHTKALHTLEKQQEGAANEAKNLKVQCLSNKAACHLNLEQYKEALKCCDQVLDELDVNNVKVMYRKARALNHLKEYDAALSVLGKAICIEPENKSLITLKRKTERAVQQEEKKQEKLFRGESKRPVSHMFNQQTKECFNNWKHKMKHCMNQRKQRKQWLTVPFVMRNWKKSN